METYDIPKIILYYIFILINVFLFNSHLMTLLPTVQSQSPVNKGGTANVMLILRQILGFKETFDNQVIHFLKWNGFKSPTIHDFEDTSAQLSLCILHIILLLVIKGVYFIIFNLFSHNLTWSIYFIDKKNKLLTWMYYLCNSWCRIAFQNFPKKIKKILTILEWHNEL